jgi:hypothetical protein
MMDRRTLLAIVLTPIFPVRLNRTRFKIGDWVQVVTLPSNTASFGSAKNPDLRRVAWVYQQCLGGRYRIIYVGEDGRPEIEVDQNIAAAVGALRYSISIEPECVVRSPVSRQSLNALSCNVTALRWVETGSHPLRALMTAV